MPINVDYDIKKMVSEGKFDEAKEIMAKNHYKQAGVISIFRDSKADDNILNFINTFEEPQWKHYVPFLNKESALKFFDFAQKNNVDLFQKVNEHNDARLIDITMGRTMDIFNNPSEFFKNITVETIGKALEKEDTFLIVKQWLEKYTQLKTEYGSTDATKFLLDKLNTPGLISEENYKKIFTRNEFTRKILELSYKEADELFNRYPNFFKNKEELTDTRILLSFYHHGDLNESISTRFKNAIETKNFNPNYDIMHATTREHIQRGEFAFSLLMDSPKYTILKQLLDNKMLPTDLYNCPDNTREPTFFERFLSNNIRTYKKKNNIEHFFNILQEVEVLQNYGIEKKSNLTSREQMNEMLEEFLGIERSRGFFSRSEKVKIDNDIEELAREIGFHPVQAQKLIEFLDKRYNFAPDAVLEQKKSQDEQTIRNSWENLMSQVVFTQELKNENNNSSRPRM